MTRLAPILGGGGYLSSAWEIGLITGLADAGRDVRTAGLDLFWSPGRTARADLARAKRTGGLTNAILRRIGSLALGAPRAKGPDRRETVAAELPIETWPEHKMLIAAVNAETGERHAFDRNSGIDSFKVTIMLMAGTTPPTTPTWPLAAMKTLQRRRHRHIMVR